jgi:DNA-binding response OmpR family regulator
MSESLRNIIVLESRSRWEPELQRQFVNEPVRVRGCRTIKELSSLTFPSTIASNAEIADVVVLQISENAAAGLQWLTSLTTQPQAPSVIILCSSESAELEWTLRDAGAREVLIDENSGERLARCCRGIW